MNTDPVQGLMNGIGKPSSMQQLTVQRLRKRQRHRDDPQRTENNDGGGSENGAEDTSSTDSNNENSSRHRHHRHHRTRTGTASKTKGLQPLASDTGLSNPSSGSGGQRGLDGNRTQKAISDRDPHQSNTGKTVGTAVGAAVGGIFLLLIGMMVYMFFRRKREAAERQKQLDASIAAGGFRSSLSSEDEMRPVKLNSTSLTGSKDATRDARKTQYIYDKDGNLEGEANVGSVGQAGWNYAHYLGAGSLGSDNTSPKQQRQLLPQQPPPAYPRSSPSNESFQYQQHYQQQQQEQQQQSPAAHQYEQQDQYEQHDQYDQQNQYGQQHYYDPNQYSQPLYRS